MKKKELTVEKLQELTGQNYSDEEAEKTVDAIKQLSLILAEFVLEQEAKEKEKIKHQGIGN